MDSSGSDRQNDSFQSSFTESQASSEDALQAGIIDFKSQIQIIEQLKFQNIIYKPGDHIALRTDPNSSKQIYGQIMLIGKAPQADFPLILVSWHYSKFQGFDTASVPPYLANKELIASSHKDWQYVQSLVSKITVLTLQEFQNIDVRQRQKAGLYFIRSRLDYENNIPTPEPPLVCHCLKPYNPDEKVISCCVCGLQFHVMCSRHQYLCINCQ